MRSPGDRYLFFRIRLGAGILTGTRICSASLGSRGSRLCAVPSHVACRTAEKTELVIQTSLALRRSELSVLPEMGSGVGGVGRGFLVLGTGARIISIGIVVTGIARLVGAGTGIVRVRGEAGVSLGLPFICAVLLLLAFPVARIKLLSGFLELGVGGGFCREVRKRVLDAVWKPLVVKVVEDFRGVAELGGESIEGNIVLEDLPFSFILRLSSSEAAAAFRLIVPKFSSSSNMNAVMSSELGQGQNQQQTQYRVVV